MKKTGLFLLLILVLDFSVSSCKHSKKPGRIVAQDTIHSGLSIDDAVIIDAKGEKQLFVIECEWLAKYYPGYTIINTNAISQNRKSYNTCVIRTADGKELTIYFDVSNFYDRQ